MNPTAEFVEAWCAVANAKLLEFRRQCWRLAGLVAFGSREQSRSDRLNSGKSRLHTHWCALLARTTSRRWSRKHSPGTEFNPFYAAETVA
jgi:hypothetical protein